MSLSKVGLIRNGWLLTYESNLQTKLPSVYSLTLTTAGHVVCLYAGAGGSARSRRRRRAHGTCRVQRACASAVVGRRVVAASCRRRRDHPQRQQRRRRLVRAGWSLAEPGTRATAALRTVALTSLPRVLASSHRATA